MERTWMPTTAGILCIIAGAISVISGIVFAPLIIVGIIAIVGGIYALRRRIWGLALAGSSFTPFGFVILGILGILALFGAYCDQPERMPFDATSAEALAIILSEPFFIGVIVGSTIVGVLGILAIIFVIMGKREFK
ncbi:MAG: hypothetical protein MUO61_07755 [Dehalococcoidia bacterium]|nr:hypothetical protein [Dehalococcoidia bacterium]